MLALVLFLALTGNFPIIWYFFVCCLEKVISFLKYCVGVCKCKGLLGRVSWNKSPFQMKFLAIYKGRLLLRTEIASDLQRQRETTPLILPFPPVVNPTVSVLVRCVRRLNRPLFEWFGSAVFIEAIILFRTSGWYYFCGGDWTNISS